MGWSTCKHCGDKIVWARMPAGNFLPMDPEAGGLHECVPFDRSAPQSSSVTWDVFEGRSHLTFETTCWWCGASVYFYRDENGGCALFDELGAPWQIHGYWEAHRAEWRAATAHFSATLSRLGFNGRDYRPERRVRRTPGTGDHSVDVSGFVVDNRALYDVPKTKSLRASRDVSSTDVAELWISSGKSEALPFTLPFDLARAIPEFHLVRATGVWVPRGSRWVLVFQSVDLLRLDGDIKKAVSTTALQGPLACRYCGEQLPPESVWGFDPEFRIECQRCSASRGRMTPAEFIDMCRRIAHQNSEGKDRG